MPILMKPVFELRCITDHVGTPLSILLVVSGIACGRDTGASTRTWSSLGVGDALGPSSRSRLRLVEALADFAAPILPRVKLLRRGAYATHPQLQHSEPGARHTSLYQMASCNARRRCASPRDQHCTAPRPSSRTWFQTGLTHSIHDVCDGKSGNMYRQPEVQRARLTCKHWLAASSDVRPSKGLGTISSDDRDAASMELRAPASKLTRDMFSRELRWEGGPSPAEERLSKETPLRRRPGPRGPGGGRRRLQSLPRLPGGNSSARRKPRMSTVVSPTGCATRQRGDGKLAWRPSILASCDRLMVALAWEYAAITAVCSRQPVDFSAPCGSSSSLWVQGCHVGSANHLCCCRRRCMARGCHSRPS